MMDEQTLAVLRVVFDAIGEEQRAISERHQSIASVEPELVRLCSTAVDLLPSGNDALWGDFHRWLIYEWAVIFKRSGASAADEWNAFATRMRAIIPPPVDGLTLND